MQNPDLSFSDDDNSDLRFDINKGDIKSRLHDQYNTFSLELQTYGAFSKPVFDGLYLSPNPLSFYEELDRQRKETLKTFTEVFEGRGCRLIGQPSLFAPKPTGNKWVSAVTLFRQGSFDALLDFFKKFDQRYPQHPTHPDATDYATTQRVVPASPSPHPSSSAQPTPHPTAFTLPASVAPRSPAQSK